jgi:hypothetical protein
MTIADIRVGLTPFDADVVCACGKRLGDDDVTHIHVQTCQLLRKRVGDARHNCVRDAIARCASAAGMDAITEYRPAVRASGQAPVQRAYLEAAQWFGPSADDSDNEHDGKDAAGDGAASAGDGAAAEEGAVDPDTELRPDLKLYGDGLELLADVCITNPSSATYRARASTKQLYAAKIMERAKCKKYKALAAAEHILFVPFVAEAYGAFGKSAERMIKGMADYQRERCGDIGSIPAAHFRGWATAMLAAAVQRAHSMLVDAAHGKVRAIPRRV